jgi:hypothetical protein
MGFKVWAGQAEYQTSEGGGHKIFKLSIFLYNILL